jgi:RNA polymerase sigma-70 factor (ECF subfamily)
MMAPEPLPRSQSEDPAPIGIVAAERELVAAVLRKDRKAAAEFVSTYTDPVYAYVRHRLLPRSDIVDDVVQEVMLAALRSLTGFRGTSSLRTWLLGIARHKVEDFYRQEVRRPEAFGEGEEMDVPAELPFPDEEIDRERLEAKTRRVMKQLPEPYSLALLWRYWENRSARDMAEATGKTEKAIERLLAHARSQFRRVWDEVP